MTRRKKPTKTHGVARKPTRPVKKAVARAKPTRGAAKQGGNLAPPARGKATERASGTPLFVEELEVALVELRRLSTELVSARRELYTEEAAGRGAEVALRRELDTLRTELKTARADLEISQANASRLAARLEAAAEAEARAREAQREAEHAADRARDELLWLRREVDRRGFRVSSDTPTEEKP